SLSLSLYSLNGFNVLHYFFTSSFVFYVVNPAMWRTANSRPYIFGLFAVVRVAEDGDPYNFYGFIL
ncbi:MAG: hypothetical protein J6A29_06730, partial [Clostridia bacterium]|nr:hypothetical protein [Clostridia bacterium]